MISDKERDLSFRATSYMFPPVRSAKNGKTDVEVRFTAEEAAAPHHLQSLHIFRILLTAQLHTFKNHSYNSLLRCKNLKF